MKSVPGALVVIFVTLKIIGIEPVASWSWWWVTCPFWIPLLLVIVFVVPYLAVRAVKKAWRH